MKFLTKIILGALALLMFFIWVEIVRSPQPQKDNIDIYFFDVGQGDSALIQQGDFQIIIDGGPSDKVLSQMAEVMPLYDHKIEMMVLTHPHADHVSGLNLILERYDVEKIYYSKVKYSSNQYKEFLENIKKEGSILEIPSIGENISPYKNSTMTFLWPGDKYQDRPINNLNNSSETFRFCYYKNCALFTGDLELDGQKMMLEEIEKNNLEIASEILKVAHHGSANGTDQQFLDLVHPKFGIISAGVGNRYGHPHEKTLDLLEKNIIITKRTDIDGETIFKINKDGITLRD